MKWLGGASLRRKPCESAKDSTHCAPFMRKAGFIDDRALAKRFGDYLLCHGVGNRIDPPEAGGGVWVHDEEHVSEVVEQLQLFLADPGAPQYNRARDAEVLRAREAAEQELAGERYVDVRSTWAESGKSRTGITASLIVVCIAVAIVGAQPDLMRGFDVYRALRFYPPELAFGTGQLWRLVTWCFIHSGLMHLGFNMMWLWSLGRQVESIHGPWRMAALCCGIAIVSGLAQNFWQGPNFVGMSGVVYGLFGYVWLQARYAPQSGYFIDSLNSLILIGWLVACMSGALGGVANAAHVGGLLAGAALGSGPFWRSRRS
ncbi:MAG: rhomboid family intramembrane serine protease [Polyangiaceae bacterium]|nr:rhomboid family intramembrane serine protease [Polyangiaceae bacterium]